MLSDAIINPFNVDPRDELMHASQPVQNWTEYMYLFGYCLESQHGVSIHIGKESSDPTIWRATLGIFLPNGELLVAKYSGRNGTARGGGAGPLQVTCVEPFRIWTADFDGLAERTTHNAIMTRVHQDTIPQLARFHLVFEGAAPMWDLEKGGDMPSLVLVDGEEAKQKNHPSKTYHWEQLMKVRGEVSYGGKTYEINGGGVRDHSFGPRNYWPLVGSLWINAVFPSGKAIMLMTTHVTGFSFMVGYVYRGDGQPLEVVKVLEHPFLSNVDTPARSVPADPLEEGAERHFKFVFQSKKGREVVAGELVHGMGTTYVSPNFELVGTALDRIKDSSQLAECPARFTWDGEVGVGVRERIVRVAALR
ncbi:MAG: hypothetical protein ABW110_12930 [Steroidobacteraceae bacterium]